MRVEYQTKAEPVSQALERAKAFKNLELTAAYDQAVALMVKDYTEQQQKTFFKQEAEARAWTLDNSTPTPHLTAMASARGISVAETVQRVLLKAEAFSAATGSLNGRLQARQDRLFGRGDAVRAAATMEEIQAIVW